MTSPYITNPKPLRPYSRPPIPPDLSSHSIPPSMNHSRPIASSYDSIVSPAGLNSSNEIDFNGMLVAGILGYMSTGLVMPFEVAKCLLQVRWEPKEGVAREVERMLGESEAAEDEKEEEEREEEKKRKKEEEDDENYFDYQSPQISKHRNLHHSIVASPSSSPVSIQPHQTVRKKKQKEVKNKDWLIVDDTDPNRKRISGIWEMIKLIASTEGWGSLWKGRFLLSLSIRIVGRLNLKH
jgi:hypothetical protein